MHDELLTHVHGNTWCLQLFISVGVYFLNEHEVVLLDSGLASTDQETLAAFLTAHNLRVRAVLGTHSHHDHSGNHTFLRETHGAEIILHETEAAVSSSYNIAMIEYGFPCAADIQRSIPTLLLPVDRTFRTEDRSIEIDGVQFGIVPLHGHTSAHTGFVTPDDVLYVGDTLLSKKMLEKFKIPSTLNWVDDMAAKEWLRTSSYAKYILSHGGVYDEISSLVAENIADRHARLDYYLSCIREAGAVTQSEIEQIMWKKLRLNTAIPLRQSVFRRNLRYAMAYMTETGMISRTFRDGTDFFEALR